MLASLAPYSEGVLPMEITLLSHKTIFTRYPVSIAWLLAAAVGTFIVAFRTVKRRF
jgi:apolipoprotein N-acyltransferase